MNKMRVTVAEFREIQGLKSQVEANSVMNLLKTQGIAIEVGKKRRTDGRGKPAVIYEIPQTVELKLFEDSDMPKTKHLEAGKAAAATRKTHINQQSEVETAEPVEA
jgi:hypothetical protein